MMPCIGRAARDDDSGHASDDQEIATRPITDSRAILRHYAPAPDLANLLPVRGIQATEMAIFKAN